MNLSSPGDFMDKFLKAFILFFTGGLIYFYIEIIYRGYSHFSMFICGGLCFYIIGGLNQWSRYELSFPMQMIIGSVVITTLEFITGLIVNVWLKWDIWDYKYMPLNIMGQICIYFSILWLFLSAAIILLDDFIRWKIFDEKKMKYRWI